MMVLWEAVEVSGENVERRVWYSCLNISPVLMIIRDERSLSRGLSSGEITEMDPRNTCGSSAGGIHLENFKFGITLSTQGSQLVPADG